MRESIDRKIKRAEEENLACDSPQPPTLVEQLIAIKSRLTREHNQRLREIDRQINALQATEAEAVIKNAEEILTQMRFL